MYIPFPFGVLDRRQNAVTSVPDHCLFIYCFCMCSATIHAVTDLIISATVCFVKCCMHAKNTSFESHFCVEK